MNVNVVNALIQVNKVLDYIPVVGTLNVIFDIFMTCVLRFRYTEEVSLARRHYFEYLKTKGMERSLWCAIPGGSIFVVWTELKCKNKDYVISKIDKEEKDWQKSILQYTSEAIKDNEEVMMRAVKKDPNLLLYASDRLKGKKELVLAAVQKGGAVLQYASKALQDDRDVVLVAVKQTGWAFPYASPRLKNDKEIALIAIENVHHMKRHLSEEFKKDPEIATTIVKNNILREMQRELQLFEGSHILGSVSMEMRSDRPFMLKAITVNPLSLKYASKELQDDEELVSIASIDNSDAFEFASDRLKDDKEFVLKLVKQKGLILKHASSKLKKDKDVTLAAVKQDGMALEFVYWECIQEHDEIPKAAVEQDKRAEKFVPLWHHAILK